MRKELLAKPTRIETGLTLVDIAFDLHIHPDLLYRQLKKIPPPDCFSSKLIFTKALKNKRFSIEQAKLFVTEAKKLITTPFSRTYRYTCRTNKKMVRRGGVGLTNLCKLAGVSVTQACKLLKAGKLPKPDIDHVELVEIRKNKIGKYSDKLAAEVVEKVRKIQGELHPHRETITSKEEAEAAWELVVESRSKRI